MKKYNKEQVIKELQTLLICYKDSKNKDNLLSLIRLITNKLENYEDVFFTSYEIEKYLFINNKDKTKSIDNNVFNFFKNIETDMKDVSFDNVIIKGYNFSKFINVKINIDKIPNKDLSKTTLKNVWLIGSLDNCNISYANFKDYKGNLVLNPTKVISMEGSILEGLTIESNFKDVDISNVNFENTLNTVMLNPQEVKNKKLHGVDLSGVMLIGPYNETLQKYEDPNFDGCYIYNTSFKDAKGNIVINLDTLKDFMIGKLYGCDLTNVKVIGTVKRMKDEKDGAIYGDDLANSYYIDENGYKVAIYPDRLVRWNKKTCFYETLSKEQAPLLDFDVTYNEKKNRI